MSDRGERLGRLAAWALVAGVGALMLTQAFGLDPSRHVAAAQSLTPFAVLGLVPVVGAATWLRWWTLAAVGAVVGLGGVVLATPLVFPPGQPAPDPTAQGVEVAVVNLLYENDRVDDVAEVLETLDADVIVFTEYTAAHQSTLSGHPVAASFPHRADRDGLRAGGTAVWSRYPITVIPTRAMFNYDVDVEIDGPDGRFRVWAVHPPTPFHPQWRDDLRWIARRAGQIDAPLLVAGDFNASYWHPAFRDLLRAGLTSAHIAAGRGWSTSWPLDTLIPPFVRIDHALTNDRLVSTEVVDFDPPGSDHRGFVVTLAPRA